MKTQQWIASICRALGACAGFFFAPRTIAFGPEPAANIKRRPLGHQSEFMLDSPPTPELASLPQTTAILALARERFERGDLIGSLGRESDHGVLFYAEIGEHCENFADFLGQRGRIAAVHRLIIFARTS